MQLFTVYKCKRKLTVIDNRFIVVTSLVFIVDKCCNCTSISLIALTVNIIPTNSYNDECRKYLRHS